MHRHRTASGLAVALSLVAAPVAWSAQTQKGKQPEPPAAKDPSKLFRETPEEEKPQPQRPQRPAQPAAPVPRSAVRVPGADAPVVPNAPRLHPIPEPGAQGEALTLLRELFADEFRKAETSPTAAKELAAELVKQADQMRGKTTPDDIASRYVLLIEAVGLSAGVRDFPSALAAADELAQSYQIDATGLKLDLLADAARDPGDAGSVEALVRTVFALSDSALYTGDLPGAAALLSQADALARKSKSVPLATEVQKRRKELRDLQGQFKNVAEAAEKLKERPDDPVSNVVVGRFYCFVAGNFERGLPLLAKGADGTLKALATRDLQRPASGDARADLAEDWWDIAGQQQGNRAQVNAKARAGYWYRLALPELGGLKRTLAQKRLDALPPEAVAGGGGGPVGNGPVRSKPTVAIYEPGPQSPPVPKAVGPVQPADRLLQLLATRFPAEARPVPEGPWNPSKADAWFNANLKPGTPVQASVKLLNSSGLQQPIPNRPPHVYVTFAVAGDSFEHNGVRHSLNIAVRLEGDKALDAVKLVQGQSGQLTGVITSARLSGWGGTKEKGLTQLIFLLTLDDIRFTPA